VILWFHNQTV